jgi:hypothetical protein
LGGILRDVTESRVVADLAAAEHFDLYQKDPVLAHFPVPRMAVKDLTLRLRFAVEDHKPRPPAADLEALLNRLWRTELAEQALPKVLAAILKRPVSRERAADLGETLMASLARTRFGLTDMSPQGLDRAAEITVARLVAGLRKWPADVRKDLAPERVVRARISRAVKERLEGIAPRFRQLAAAHQTAQLDLDVLVKRADLSGVQEAAMQEVTISITTDDLQVASAPAPAPSEKA